MHIMKNSLDKILCTTFSNKKIVILMLTAYNPKEWKESKDVIYPAVAIYDFVAASEKELSFNAGQTMVLAPKELQPKDVRGWLLATVDGSRVGYVPYNYIRVLPATGQVAGHSTQSIPVPVANARVDSYQGRM
jgi:hypothetical protein